MNAPDSSEPAEHAPPIPPGTDGRAHSTVIFNHSLLDDYGLTPSVFRVYAHIARRASSGLAWSANKSMAHTCRLHPQTVRRSLNFLVQHQLITREPRVGLTTIYRLTPASQWLPPPSVTGNHSKSHTSPSASDATSAKPVQARPYETNGVKGSPLEGNPTKAKIHTQPVRRLPFNEIEAAEAAKLAGIPEEFARSEYNRMVAVGWLDGCQRPVLSWPHYLKQRWVKEQSDRAERKARPTARPARNGAPVPPRKFESTNYQQPLDKF